MKNLVAKSSFLGMFLLGCLVIFSGCVETTAPVPLTPAQQAAAKALITKAQGVFQGGMDFNGKYLDLTMLIKGVTVDAYSAAIGAEINENIDRYSAYYNAHGGLEKYNGIKRELTAEGNELVFTAKDGYHTMHFHFQDDNTLVGYRDDYPNALWVLHRVIKK